MQQSCFKMLWMVMRSMGYMLYGHYYFSRLPRKVVTVFGGHRVAVESRYGKAAYHIAQAITSCGHVIVTGGGGGIMDEANKGACAGKTKKRQVASVSITVQNLQEDTRSTFVDFSLDCPTFFARKWLLMNFSQTFLIFPGGFGTVDEFVEMLVLLKTNRMQSKTIFLFGKDFWEPFVQWAWDKLVGFGYADVSELSYFKIVDSVDEAVEQLKACCVCKN